MTSGPDPGELPGFWGSMVFRHGPIPRKGSGKQQQVKVEQIATEIQTADSVTSDTQQPEEPYCHKSKAAESESPNSEIYVKLDAILNFSRNSQK